MSTDASIQEPIVDVAIFLSALPIGSRERLMLGLATELAQAGHKVQIVSVGITPAWLKSAPQAPQIVNLASWTSRVPLLRTINVAKLLFSLPALMKYLCSARPSVLLSVSIPPSLTSLLAARIIRWTNRGLGKPAFSTRQIIRQSNVIRIAGSDEYGGIKRRFRDRWIPNLYLDGARIIAVSEGVADNLRQLIPEFPASDITVIPNLVIGEGFRDRAKMAVKHPWLEAQKENRPYRVAVAVGRLVAKKDYPTMFRALANARSERDVRLIVLGEGPQRRALGRLAIQLGIDHAIDLPGHVSTPPAYLSRADLYVLSSISEGMPSALIEALASGCNVVSTNCPSGPAEILRGGVGRLVPVGDDVRLARAICDALENPLDKKIMLNRARRYSRATGVSRYLDVIRSELERGHDTNSSLHSHPAQGH